MAEVSAKRHDNVQSKGSEEQPSAQTVEDFRSLFPRTKFDFPERLRKGIGLRISPEELFRNVSLNPRDTCVPTDVQLTIRSIVADYLPQIERLRRGGAIQRDSEMRALIEAGRIAPLEYSDAPEVQAALANSRPGSLVFYSTAAAYKTTRALTEFIPYAGRAYGATKDELPQYAAYAQALTFVLQEMGSSVIISFEVSGCLYRQESQDLLERLLEP